MTNLTIVNSFNNYNSTSSIHKENLNFYLLFTNGWSFEMIFVSKYVTIMTISAERFTSCLIRMHEWEHFWIYAELTTWSGCRIPAPHKKPDNEFLPAAGGSTCAAGPRGQGQGMGHLAFWKPQYICDLFKTFGPQDFKNMSKNFK